MNGNSLQALMQIIGNGGNPQQILQMVAQRNPQFAAMLNQQKQSGMSMEQFVRQLYKQNNVDINPMLNALKQKGIK